MTDKDICTTLLVLGELGIIAGIFINHLLSKRTKRNRSNWIKVNGNVTSSFCRHVGPSGEDDKTTDHYAILVRFSYVVGGIRYSGKQGWQSDVETQCIPMAPITVFYYPMHPKKAVVQPEEIGNNWITWVIILPSTFFLLLGAAGWFSTM
jgi:hypothetical protein